MLADLSLPEGSSFIRATPEFTDETVPAALLNAHRVAHDTWGLLRVHRGAVTYVLEHADESRLIHAGETQVIEPDTPHRVVVGEGAAFVVEFHR